MKLIVLAVLASVSYRLPGLSCGIDGWMEQQWRLQ